MFRIPKFAAQFYRSQIDLEKEIVLEPLTLWSNGELNGGNLTPIVVFTNCERVELILGGKSTGRYYPDRKTYPGIDHPPVIIKDIPGEWGADFKDCTFKGLIKDKEVCSRSFLKNPIPVKLLAIPDDLQLNSGDYDVTRVVYKIIDSYGNLIPFINEYIRFDISGPGNIIGPKQTAFIGGCIGVWVKTTGIKGLINLSAECSRFKADNVEISVI